MRTGVYTPLVISAFLAGCTTDLTATQFADGAALIGALGSVVAGRPDLGAAMLQGDAIGGGASAPPPSNESANDHDGENHCHDGAHDHSKTYVCR